MSAVPDVEESVSSKELTRRAWIAVGVSEVVFSVATVLGGWAAISVTDESSKDGWAELSLVIAILLIGIGSVLFALPIAVHTIGRATVRRTEGWPSWKAGLAHLVVGLVCGAGLAGLVVATGAAGWLAAVLAFMIPPGLAGWAANTAVPYAARHAWVVRLAWALALVPIGGALYYVVQSLAWGVFG